jgi:hypothetical protein
MIPIHRILLLAAVLPMIRVDVVAAQRYAAPAGRHEVTDTTVAFASGDVVRVSWEPRMASGMELCGTVSGRMQWGKMLFARTDADSTSAQQTVVSFPSIGVTPQCEVHRSAGGTWLVVDFARPVRDPAGRIGRIPVGRIVLPAAPLEGRRVTFVWEREGSWEVESVTPPPDTVGPPSPPGTFR